MKFFFHIFILFNLISKNQCFYVNNLFINRRNLLSYTTISHSILNDNIQMNNQYNNTKSNDNTNNNFYLNKNLNKKDFKNYNKKSHLYSKSNIFFIGELTDETCCKLSESLLNQKNILMSNTDYGNHINLYIQSPGGSLLPTLGVVDEIINSEIPIYTYIKGYAASAATLLSIAGHHRLMYNHSLMMVHSVRTEHEIHSYNEVKDVYDNLNIFMKIIKDIYLDNSNIKEELLDELLKKDSWLTSSDALKYGFIDEII